MSETGQEVKAVHEAMKRLDEYHRDSDIRLIRVDPEGHWTCTGTFDTDRGTVSYSVQTGFWEVAFEDDEGATGVVEQVQL